MKTVWIGKVWSIWILKCLCFKWPNLKAIRSLVNGARVESEKKRQKPLSIKSPCVLWTEQYCSLFSEGGRRWGGVWCGEGVCFSEDGFEELFWGLPRSGQAGVLGKHRPVSAAGTSVLSWSLQRGLGTWASWEIILTRDLRLLRLLGTL